MALSGTSKLVPFPDWCRPEFDVSGGALYTVEVYFGVAGDRPNLAHMETK